MTSSDFPRCLPTTTKLARVSSSLLFWIMVAKWSKGVEKPMLEHSPYPLKGLHQEILSLSEATRVNMAHSLAVEKADRDRVLLRQLLEDVKGLLGLLPTKVNVKPRLGELGQGGIILRVLHDLELLPRQVNTANLEQNLDLECLTKKKTKR